MVYRKLDPATLDYTFGVPNGAGYYTGTDAVAQAVLTSLKLLDGEWWEDTSAGLQLFSAILAAPGTQAGIAAVTMLVQQAITAVQDVLQITAFTSLFDSETRRYTFSCMLQTTYGEVGLTGVTLGP